MGRATAHLEIVGTFPGMTTRWLAGGGEEVAGGGEEVAAERTALGLVGTLGEQ